MPKAYRLKIKEPGGVLTEWSTFVDRERAREFQDWQQSRGNEAVIEEITVSEEVYRSLGAEPAAETPHDEEREEAAEEQAEAAAEEAQESAEEAVETAAAVEEAIGEVEAAIPDDTPPEVKRVILDELETVADWAESKAEEAVEAAAEAEAHADAAEQVEGVEATQQEAAIAEAEAEVAEAAEEAVTDVPPRAAPAWYWGDGVPEEAPL